MQRPVCRECQKPWRWPRNIAHMSVMEAPKGIYPTTKSTVVAHLATLPGTDPPMPVVPENVFRNLELVQTSKGCCGETIKLVDEFRYDTETGQVYFDGKEPANSDMEFASLVTLTSWYRQLLQCLREVSLSVLDHYANGLLALSIIFGREDELWDDFAFSKYIFAIGFILMLLLSILVATYSSLREWRLLGHKSVGDLSLQTSWFDEFHAFVALVIFNVFMVSGHVKNVVIRLHPWKSIQPYAAIKIDGTRAYVVGYLNKELYVVSSRSGSFYSMLLLLVLKSCVFIFKVYVAVCTVLGFAGDAPAYSILISCISSLGSIALGWYNFARLVHHRGALYTQLQQTVKELAQRCPHFPGPCSKKHCGQCTEMQRRRSDAAIKFLMKEYNCTHYIHDQKNKDLKLGSIISEKTTKKDECVLCGRNKETTEYDDRCGQEISENDYVRLTDYHDQFHDAKFGCLKSPFDVGKVLKVVPKGPAGPHARCLVECRLTGDKVDGRRLLSSDCYWTKLGVSWAEDRADFESDLQEDSKVTPEHFETFRRLKIKAQEAIEARHLEVGVPWWYDERALRKVGNEKSFGALRKAGDKYATQQPKSLSSGSLMSAPAIFHTGMTPKNMTATLPGPFADTDPLPLLGTADSNKLSSVVGGLSVRTIGRAEPQSQAPKAPAMHGTSFVLPGSPGTHEAMVEAETEP